MKHMATTVTARVSYVHADLASASSHSGLQLKHVRVVWLLSPTTYCFAALHFALPHCMLQMLSPVSFVCLTLMSALCCLPTALSVCW